jgi:hypothetical protein
MTIQDSLHPKLRVATRWFPMSFEEALTLASRDDGFKATVYAMNTLLIAKGIYTQEEFEALLVEWVDKEQRRKASEPRRPEASSAYSA